jgi:hypothetical protein
LAVLTVAIFAQAAGTVKQPLWAMWAMREEREKQGTYD